MVAAGLPALKADDSASCVVKPVGCFATQNLSVLAVARGSWTNLDRIFCASLCAQDAYVGVSNGTRCFCGNEINSNATLAPNSSCNVPCAGNSAETCGGQTIGGFGFIFIFGCGNAPPAPVPPACAVTKSLGCFSNADKKALPISRGSFSGMDMRMCTKLCRPDVSQQSSIMGVQNGTSCFCGESVNKNAQKLQSSECSTPCAGNISEDCGGANALSVFQAECKTCCSRWCTSYGKCTACVQRGPCGRGRGRGGCCEYRRACCDQSASCDPMC
eukprot:SAG22_NODE_54_length_23787_cov_12.917511_6_plen_273_part_00